MARNTPKRLCVETRPEDMEPGDRINFGHFDKLVEIKFIGEQVVYKFEEQDNVKAHPSNWPLRWDGKSWTEGENVVLADGTKYRS